MENHTVLSFVFLFLYIVYVTLHGLKKNNFKLIDKNRIGYSKNILKLPK